MKVTTQVLLVSSVFAVWTAQAKAEDWWPAKVGNDGVTVDYVPLEKASQKWKICVLFPHVKDSLWVAAAYGATEEAKRLGISLTLYQAGGYDNLTKQLSQFDDCVAAGADAIVTGAISEAGLAKKFDEGLSKKIPQISVINPVANAPVTAKVSVDYPTMGKLAADYVLSELAGKPAQVAAFPGPQGSGWAEGFFQGFEMGLKGSPAEIVDTQWGDTGVAVQLKLVEDSLQAHPDISYIWGAPPAIEAAVSAVADAGKDADISLVSSYENQAMLGLLKDGSVKSFPTLAPVLEARMAIDTAVRVLEDKPYYKTPLIVPEMLSADNLSTTNLDNIFAPDNWQPVYSIN